MDFKYFPMLPTEMRLEIWRHALLFERVIEIAPRALRPGDARDRHHRYFKSSPHSLMSVNRESRREAIHRLLLLNLNERNEALGSELWKDPIYLKLKPNDTLGVQTHAAELVRRTNFTTIFNPGVDTIYINFPSESLSSYHRGYSLWSFSQAKDYYHFTGLAIAARAFSISDKLLGQKLSIVARLLIRLKNVRELFLVFEDEDLQDQATSGDCELLTTSFAPYPAYQNSKVVDRMQKRLKIKATVLNYAHREHQKLYPHHFPMQPWVAPEVRAMKAVRSSAS